MPATPSLAQSRDAVAIGKAVAELTAAFGNRVVTSQAVREQHGHTTTWHQQSAAGRGGVRAVRGRRAADRAHLRASIARRSSRSAPALRSKARSMRRAAASASTSSDMNRILAVHAEDLDCVVEPGVTRKQLNEYLRDQGLFFPIDPGADASIGGMAATRASGTNAVRYGTMKDNVLSLKAVLPNGELISTASRAKKSSAGYDLTRLFVGSEGTLGVITEITLKLHGIPESIAAGVCPFPSVEAACNATILTIQSGIPVARIELLDELQVKACNAYSKLTLPESADAVRGISRHRSRARPSRPSASARSRPNSAAARSNGRPRRRTARGCGRRGMTPIGPASALRPGAKAIATDVCVPISRLAECVDGKPARLAESRLVAPIVGHVGDGNFHMPLLVDMDDSDEVPAPMPS